MTRSSAPDDPKPSSAAEAWNQRYAEGRTRWDLGGPPPVLTSLLATIEPGRRVLVPGAGRGHDAIAWAQAGHRVVAIDIAPLAVEAARALADERSVQIEVLEADIFALPGALTAAFDVVWEQTCFCAIPVERRGNYVRAMAQALVPGGKLYGLFWNHGQPGGPPFDVRREDVEAAFPPVFAIESIEAVKESVPQRRPEFLAVMRRV
jgi:SAM-dependent methyltransferase